MPGRNAAEAPSSIRAWVVVGLVARSTGDAEIYAQAKSHFARLAADRDIQAPAI